MVRFLTGLILIAVLLMSVIGGIGMVVDFNQNDTTTTHSTDSIDPPQNAISGKEVLKSHHQALASQTSATITSNIKKKGVQKRSQIYKFQGNSALLEDTVPNKHIRVEYATETDGFKVVATDSQTKSSYKKSKIGELLNPYDAVPVPDISSIYFIPQKEVSLNGVIVTKYTISSSSSSTNGHAYISRDGLIHKIIITNKTTVHTYELSHVDRTDVSPPSWYQKARQK